MQVLFVLLSVAVSQYLCDEEVGPRRFFETHDGFIVIPDIPQLADGENRELFQYEQTIVMRDSSQWDGTVLYCEVFQIHKRYEEFKISQTLELLLQTNLYQTDMVGIMSLLRECDSLDANRDTSRENFHLLYLFERGILPGTKWCGNVDTVHNYHDLGYYRDTDRCCRNHSFCPITIIAGDHRYNLTNNGEFTRSHCQCEEAFYECLDKISGFNVVETVYFDFIPKVSEIQCVNGVPEIPWTPMEIIPYSKYKQQI